MRQRASSFSWVLLVLGVVGVFSVVGAAGIWVGVRLAARQAKQPPPAFVVPNRAAERQEAAAVFVEPAAPDTAEQRDLTAFFKRLGLMFDNPNVNLSAYFDFDQMYDELLNIGTFRGLGPRVNDSFRRDFQAGMQKSTGPKVREAWSRLKWQTAEVRRMSTGKNKDVVAYVVIMSEDDVRCKMRFWLTNKPGHGWRLCDWEDLDVGIRATHAAGAAMSAANGDLSKLAELQVLANIPKAITALGTGELETARKLLDECRKAAETGPFRDLYDLIEASYELHANKPADAVRRLDQLIRRNPDMPRAYVLRSSARLYTREYEWVAADAEQYLKMLGADAEAYTNLAIAREGQGRPEEALALFRKAVAEEPGHLNALHGVLRVLPIANKKEFLPHLAKAPKPHDLYDELIEVARDTDDGPAIEVLAGWLYKERPDDLRAICDLIPFRTTAGKHAESIELYKAGLTVAEGDRSRSRLRTVFLDAMAQENLHIEAYSVVPDPEAKEAFSSLASDLDETSDDGTADETRLANEILTKLIAAHRDRVPTDLWPSYFEGQQLMRAKDYAAADKKFAGALTKIPFEDDSERDYASHYTAFRVARVDSMYRLGQGLMAYRNLPAKAATFDQLARLYQGDRDVAGLRKLLDAHRQAEPKAPALDYWTAQLHWEQKEYGPAVRLLKQYAASARAKDNERLPYSWIVNDQITRGLVRLQRPQEASVYVASLGEHPPALLRILSLAANNDHTQAMQLMFQLSEHNKRQPGIFYNDPDLGPYLKRDEYKIYRDLHPPPAPMPGTVG